MQNAPVSEMASVLSVLEKMGAVVRKKDGEVYVCHNRELQAVNVETKVYPGFPTDLQSPMIVLMTQANGIGQIKENIYENRFRIVSELKKMNAKMQLNENEVTVYGPEALKGAVVRAKELRGNAALIMAGLIAEGETDVLDCSYVKRGYEDICRDLKCLGAIIYENEEG